MKDLPMPNPTTRDLLETVAGEDHACHSVAYRKHLLTVTTITCSCGEVFKVTTSPAVTAALRNVTEIVPS